jgi:ribosome-associated protein
MKTEKILDLIADALEEKKVQNLQRFDLGSQHAFADVVMIGTGSSMVHLHALKESVIEKMRKAKIRKRQEVGTPDSGWVILDFGDCLIHLLTPQERTLYALEEFFVNASVVYHYD